MPSPLARRSAALGFALTLAACAADGPEFGRLGEATDGSSLVATGQRVRPAGDVLRFAGQPVDLVLSSDGRTAYLKGTREIVVVDCERLAVLQRLPFGDTGDASMHGIALGPDGTLVTTDAKHALRTARAGADGRLAWVGSIDLGAGEDGEPYPCGLALAPGGRTATVCLSRRNALAVVDLERGVVTREIAVGVAPFDVVLAPDGATAWVSDFGGRRPREGERTADSSGTAVLVDDRGIAASGTVTRVDLAAGRASGALEAGLHPTDLVLSPDGGTLYVAAANSDAVVVIDTASFVVRERIDVRLDPALPFGCITNALSGDGRHLFAANGGNNALAVVQLGERGEPSRVLGFVPTDWFPGALACRGDELFVACVRGDGSREPREEGRRHVTWTRGSLARVTPAGGRQPARWGAGELARWSEQARGGARVGPALRAAERARGGARPRPVPARLGDPSVFEHVVYVIKENRTYDQVLGDLPQGNGDPRLCIYGREVTPNHHALAEEFALLDNYYCNGVVSADGHQWATQGIVVDYQEKQSGGWTRSYDFGSDALTYAASGFLWDAVLMAGLSFRNYGELDFPTLRAPDDWFGVYADWRAGGERLDFAPRVDIEGLRRYSAPRYPGWEMRIPDQVRVDRFLEEFRAAEASGEWPSLVLVYLPQDHTSGTSESAPTPRAHVADNDLALGRLVEAISKSRFWPTTCVFVNEDDPQDGFDHVDGHRSLCLVVSPYTRRGAVVSRFFNQTSVLHTIERMLAIPPMNQLDALAPTMEACFQDEPDLAPYAARANLVPLDERNPSASGASADPAARPFARISRAADLSRPDRIDDDAWNRTLWFAARGAEAYPAEWAGAHGRGLAGLSLSLAPEQDNDDGD